MTEWLVQHKDLAEALSYWATSGGILVAVFAGVLTVLASRQQRRQDNWNKAHELHSIHLQNALKYPEFFDNYWNRENLSAEDRWRYRKFVTFMIWGIEDIAEANYDEDWRKAMLYDLAEHSSYLGHEVFQSERACYFTSVKGLIDEAIAFDKNNGTVANA